jgi:multiple sugar transport system permease protein/putative chitobiose transport system permease protein
VVVPVLWSLSASFTPLAKVFENTSPFTWRALLPVAFTLDAYTQVLGDPVFVRSIINSAVMSSISVALGIVIASAAGFAFAKFQFRGRDALFGLVLLTFMVPIEAIVIPMFSMMRSLGWLNTWQGLIVPGLANGLVVFLFRQFFREFPSALIEAARVDGASWPTILLRIVVPLSRPVLLSAALLLWIATWNSYFWPLVVAPTEDLRVVQVAISAAVTEHNVLWPRLFAGSVIATLVPLLLVLPFQRYYVRSIAGIGVKG